MEKPNSSQWVEDNLFELITLKLLMESLIDVLEKLLDGTVTNPKRAAMISQQEIAPREFLEKLANLKISKRGRCGTPYAVKKQSEPLDLSTSPINTPKRPAKQPFTIWSDNSQVPTEDPEAVFVPISGGTEHGDKFNTAKKTNAATGPVVGATRATSDSRQSADRPGGVVDEREGMPYPSSAASANAAPTTKKAAAQMEVPARAGPSSHVFETSKEESEGESGESDETNDGVFLG